MVMDESSSSSPRYSERFRAADADVMISSSDGVLFKVHRKNLEVYSEGFPGTDVPVHGEVVLLSEKASTLELLFQYMYRERQPDLSKVGPDELALLAEAAEKYLVYSAMEVCKVHMQLAIPTMPLKVLGYAAKHGYESLCVDAAQWTVEAKAADALKHMDPICFAKWVLYREHWLELMSDTHRPIPAPLLHKGGLPECPLWLPFQAKVLEDFGTSLVTLRTLQAVVDRHWPSLNNCVQCTKRAQHWVYLIQAKREAIPKFSLGSESSES